MLEVQILLCVTLYDKLCNSLTLLAKAKAKTKRKHALNLYDDSFTGS